MFVEVALPLGLYQTFIYRLNTYIDPKSLIGRRVLVPFGKLKYYGFITDIIQNVSQHIEVKNVLHIDDFNTFTEKEIQLIRDISAFYVSPVGLTAYYFAPNYLKGKKLEDPFYEKIFRLNPYKEPPKKISIVKKHLLEVMLNLGEVSFTQLKMMGFKKATVESLLKEGFLVEVKNPENTGSLKQTLSLFEENKKLSKTIYTLSFLPDLDRLKLIVKYSKSLLDKGYSSLLILPSVLAVNKYYQFMSTYIPNLKLYHDAIPAKKQLEVWLSVMKEPAVVVGTMSSLLIPLKNLKLICVEFEHSNSYRSPITPRFDTKRVAYMVGKAKSTAVIYSDKLPSLESYIMLRSKKALTLKNQNAIVKNIEVKKFNGFSKAIKDIEKILNTSGTTLIIVNKSYYAAYVYCERCGFEWLCDKCDVYLRVIKKDNKKVLKCPECGKEETYDGYCPDCDNKLTEEGFGSYKLVDYLKNFDISIYEENRDTRIKIMSSIEGKAIFEKYDTVINLYPDFLRYIDRYDANEQLFRAVISPIFIKSDKLVIFSNILQDTTLLYKVLKGEEEITKIYEEELNFRQKFRYPPVEKYTKLEFWAKRETSIYQLKETLMLSIKKEDIKFEYQKGLYYKIILKNPNKKNLEQIYEKFSVKGKLSIEVNTKNI